MCIYIYIYTDLSFTPKYRRNFKGLIPCLNAPERIFTSHMTTDIRLPTDNSHTSLEHIDKILYSDTPIG